MVVFRCRVLDVKQVKFDVRFQCKVSMLGAMSIGFEKRSNKHGGHCSFGRKRPQGRVRHRVYDVESDNRVSW